MTLFNDAIIFLIPEDAAARAVRKLARLALTTDLYYSLVRDKRHNLRLAMNIHVTPVNAKLLEWVFSRVWGNWPIRWPKAQKSVL